MSGTPGAIDLLNPSPMLQGHYIHQLRTTIQAYSATQIVVGEVLQNAIDAVVVAGGTQSSIDISLDFDRQTVTIRDNGTGFPNDPQLLFLGGTRKKNLANKKIFGLVGVGLKVVLFSSENFRIRARYQDGTSFRYEIDGAYRFEQDPPPSLMVPSAFAPDSAPLASRGTEIEYRFPKARCETSCKILCTNLSRVACQAARSTTLAKSLPLACSKRSSRIVSQVSLPLSSAVTPTPETS